MGTLDTLTQSCRTGRANLSLHYLGLGAPVPASPLCFCTAAEWKTMGKEKDATALVLVLQDVEAVW